jgi:beta-lactamase superfamily II metal-dependent hydrolase
MLKLAREKNVVLNGTVIQSILIDAGNDSGKAKKIQTYLTDVGIDKINYILTSHYHRDHLGGYPYLLGRVNSAPNAKAYDRGDGKPKGKSDFDDYRGALLGYTLIKIPAPVPPAHIATSIDLGTGNNGQQIKLTCIATDTSVLDGTEVNCASNQNDFDVAWLLQYGQFSYLTSGDLGGFDKGGYVDVETSMIGQVNSQLGLKHICACKLNHHGSEHSSNPYYLSLMKPKTAVISVGDRKYGNDYHPHSEVIEDLEAAQWDISSWLGNAAGTNMAVNPIEKYYVTSLRKYLGDPRDQIGKAGKKGMIGGDIVIIVDDTNIDTKSKYAVYYNGEKPGVGVVKDNDDMRKCNPASLDHYDCH